ncbi:uncharacterized protein LOC115890493, partial [Sitophilus oryzae]|uniref:Uncharacterized protein LOC115890493 n=1 Tax=Sitophilus oryzae TaxID=7048 RepID=A0A6J2YTT3_SITOR
NAMRTAFRVLNADEVETGSRGGMDGAMAAQPADGARPMVHLPFSDSSSSSCDDNDVPGFNPLELSCTTQQFNFNLNAMQVSTPQNKIHISEVSNEQDLHSTKKRLFGDNKLHEDKALSTILEEKSGCISREIVPWSLDQFIESVVLNDIQQRFEDTREVIWREDYKPILDKVTRICSRVKETLQETQQNLKVASIQKPDPIKRLKEL